MEEERARYPLINSFIEEHSISSVEWNKKRKLQNESDLPSPKHKCRDWYDSSDRVFPTPEGKEIENSYKTIAEEGSDKNVADKLDQEAESDEDSNSYVEDNDTGAIWEEDKIEMLSSKALFHDQPSTSWDSRQSNAFKTALYSLESRNVWETNASGKAKLMNGKYTCSDIIDQFEAEYEDNEGNHPEFGLYDDYITGFENKSTSDEINDEILIYTNDLTSNEFVLSSGRWNVRQDARQLGARKPTIDQEFEQYFSTLML